MKRLLRFFQSPAFTASEWSSRNPYLVAGEIGYLIEGGVVTKSKCGPGHWNSLDFVDQDVYPYTDEVTNPIGDVTTPPTGQKVTDIIRDLISPYIAPAAVNLVNNLGGTYLGTVVREVGESFATAIQINFSVSSSGNLSGATPVIVDGDGVFTGGNFANTPPLTLPLVSSPLAPTSMTTIEIGVSFTQVQGGATTPQTTLIKFLPRIMWFSSNLSSIANGATFMAQGGRQSIVTDDYTADYVFPGNGYSWIALPSMFAASGLIFTDVTNPNIPLDISMQSIGTISINNNVGTYNYDLYRSEFNLIAGTTLRIN